MTTENTERDDSEKMLEDLKAYQAPDFEHMTREDWQGIRNILQIFLFATKKDTENLFDWTDQFGAQFDQFYQEYFKKHPQMLHDWYAKAIDGNPDNDAELLENWEAWKEKDPEATTME